MYIKYKPNLIITEKILLILLTLQDNAQRRPDLPLVFINNAMHHGVDFIWTCLSLTLASGNRQVPYPFMWGQILPHQPATKYEKIWPAFIREPDNSKLNQTFIVLKNKLSRHILS